MGESRAAKKRHVRQYRTYSMSQPQTYALEKDRLYITICGGAGCGETLI